LEIYPPKIVYPDNYDTDYNLLKVYNTSEAPLTDNLEAWATEIYLKPVPPGKPEIWADNGYVTISGELIYYDKTLKDYATGKVKALLNCIRNLGGEHTQYNPAGTFVRGFVIAEHHNQLARAIANIENFVGIENSTNKNTLDWKIRNIYLQQPIIDDTCPTVTFYYYITNESNSTGTTIEYELEIIGNYDSFLIDFGDGNSDSANLTGTHNYAPNNKVDPLVRVDSPNCEIVQSAIDRNEPNEPLVQILPVNLDVILPDLPEVPQLDFNVGALVNSDIQLPPIVFPCLDIGPFGPIQIPSVINIVPPINIPSVINFGSVPNIPSNISISPFPPIPSQISVDITPAVIDITGGNACNICSQEVKVVNGKPASYPYTTGTCFLCAGDTGKISKVEIYINDFNITGTTDWGSIKLLVQSPSGKTVLLMGSGSVGSDFKGPVNLKFTDSATNYLYDLTGPLQNGSYKPSPNNNQSSSSDGRSTLAAPAPQASISSPYGTSLQTFKNDDISSTGWSFWISSNDKNLNASFSSACVDIQFTLKNICPTPTPTPATPSPSTPATPSPSSPRTPTSPVTPRTPTSPGGTPVTPITPGVTPISPGITPQIPPISPGIAPQIPPQTPNPLPQPQTPPVAPVPVTPNPGTITPGGCGTCSYQWTKEKCLDDFLCTYKWEGGNWVLYESDGCATGTGDSKWPCGCLTPIEAQALGLLPANYRNCAEAGQPQKPCDEFLGCYKGRWEEMQNNCTSKGTCAEPNRAGTYIDEGVASNCQCTTTPACGKCKYQWVVVPGKAGKWVEYEVTGDCEFTLESSGCNNPAVGSCEYTCTSTDGVFSWILSSTECTSPCSCANNAGPCGGPDENMSLTSTCGYPCLCPGEPDGEGVENGQIYPQDCEADSSVLPNNGAGFALYNINFETSFEAKEFEKEIENISFSNDINDIKSKLSFRPIELQTKSVFVKNLNLSKLKEDNDYNVKEIPFVNHELKFNDKEAKIYKIREKSNEAKPDLSDIFGDENESKDK
jgi:hypothetical protein